LAKSKIAQELIDSGSGILNKLFKSGTVDDVVSDAAIAAEKNNDILRNSLDQDVFAAGSREASDAATQKLVVDNADIAAKNLDLVENGPSDAIAQSLIKPQLKIGQGFSPSSVDNISQDVGSDAASLYDKLATGGKIAAGVGAAGLGASMLMGEDGKVPPRNQQSSSGMSREEFYPGYPTRQPNIDPLMQQAPMPASVPTEKIPNPKSAGAVRPSAPEIKVTEESVPKSESVTDDIEGFTNNTVEDLQNAQRQASDARLANELGRASELIGTSISNTRPIAQEIFTQQAKDSDRIVDDFEKRAEKEEADPNSMISAQFRDYLKKFGINVPSSTSAKAAAKIMPYAYQKFAAKEAQIARSAETDKELAARAKENALTRASQREQNELRREEMKLGRQEKREQKLTDSQTRFSETIGKAVQNKEYDKYSKLNNVKSRAQMALENPSGQRDAALVYDFVKALDPDSAVREGEISFVGGAASIPQKIRKYMISATTGQQLLPEQRNEIIAVINKSFADQQKAWKSSIQPALNRAKRLGIDESLVMPADMPEDVAPKAEKSATPQQAPKAEKTVVKKGYNRKTNQTQLIYSDGTKEIVEGKK
jgi:uncharacterized protein YnzC (UPF0291/DUF896 family)